jgi:plasmid stabilization system protein ParE
MDVIFHPLADDEYWDQVDFYNTISSNLSKRFESSFDDVIIGISTNPHLCHNRGNGIYSVRVRGFPFSIFYKLSNGKIFILSVCHERRNPNIWKSRNSIP